MIRSFIFFIFLVFFAGISFFLAGSFGLGYASFFFGLLYSIARFIYRKKPFRIKWFVFSNFIASLIVYLLLYFCGMAQPEKEVVLKLSLLKKELEEKSYQPKWFIISQRRNRLFNALLLNSAKESNHLKGKAIDIFVIDIDGDGSFDLKDIHIIEKANHQVERKHPELIGALGDYFLPKNSRLTRHMIHIDTRGKKCRYPRFH